MERLRFVLDGITLRLQLREWFSYNLALLINQILFSTDPQEILRFPYQIGWTDLPFQVFLCHFFHKYQSAHNALHPLYRIPYKWLLLVYELCFYCCTCTTIDKSNFLCSIESINIRDHLCNITLITWIFFNDICHILVL